MYRYSSHTFCHLSETDTYCNVAAATCQTNRTGPLSGTNCYVPVGGKSDELFPFKRLLPGLGSHNIAKKSKAACARPPPKQVAKQEIFR